MADAQTTPVPPAAAGAVGGGADILLDEPTAMLAPKVSRELYDFIATLPDRGITVVLVDQNVRQCAAVSDYLYVLDLGANRAEGASADFGDDEGLKAMIQEWLDDQID